MFSALPFNMPAKNIFNAPFLPSDLGANLRLWTREGGVRYQDSARTTLVTAATNPIGSWTDNSSNAYHIFQATAGARPVENTAMDGATFNGLKIMTTPSLGAYAGDFFIGMVITPTTLAAGYVRFLERVASGGGVYLGTNGVANGIVAFINGTACPSTPLTPGVKHYIGLERIGTTAKLYIDSTTAIQTWTVTATAIPDAATQIGGPDGGGAMYDGDMHEIIIAKDVTAGNVTSLLVYLATV